MELGAACEFVDQVVLLMGWDLFQSVGLFLFHGLSELVCFLRLWAVFAVSHRLVHNCQIVPLSQVACQ